MLTLPVLNQVSSHRCNLYCLACLQHIELANLRLVRSGHEILNVMVFRKRIPRFIANMSEYESDLSLWELN